MNKTLMLTLENMKKIEPIVIGWNIAQWGTSQINYDVDCEIGEIHVDDKIPHNRLKMMVVEAQIAFKSASVQYSLDNLNGKGKSIATTLALLEELILLDILDLNNDDNHIDFIVPFYNCELVEKVLKKFKIIA